MKTATAIAVVAGALRLGGFDRRARAGSRREPSDRGGTIEPRRARSGAKWPGRFPTDQWGKGKAFRCKARDCGTEVNLYIRAKIGFCNCTTGIADDEELDRLGDLDLIGSEVAPRLGRAGRSPWPG